MHARDVAGISLTGERSTSRVGCIYAGSRFG